MKNKLCPCHSDKPYSTCCRPYHQGLPAPTALALMRSRYSAYALHQASYIISTTHPHSVHFESDSKKWRREILSFCQSSSFEGLEIVEDIEGEREAYVTFIAQLSQREQDLSFKEKSRFEKLEERWYYCAGEPLPLL